MCIQFISIRTGKYTKEQEAQHPREISEREIHAVDIAVPREETNHQLSFAQQVSESSFNIDVDKRNVDVFNTGFHANSSEEKDDGVSNYEKRSDIGTPHSNSSRTEFETALIDSYDEGVANYHVDSSSTNSRTESSEGEPEIFGGYDDGLLNHHKNSDIGTSKRCRNGTEDDPDEFGRSYNSMSNQEMDFDTTTRNIYNSRTRNASDETGRNEDNTSDVDAVESDVESDSSISNTESSHTDNESNEDDTSDDNSDVEDVADDENPDSSETVVPDFRCIEKCGYFFEQLHEKFDTHSLIACPLKDLKLTKVHRKGLKVQYFIKCQRCGFEDNIWSEPTDDGSFDINTAAVMGTITAGAGFDKLDEMLAAMNVKCMTAGTYRKYRELVTDVITDCALDSMEAAGKEEKRLAIDRGDVINGIPFITVTADGQWAKRSYGHSFNALAGVSVIIGIETGKVLFIGIRNKYCSYCAYYERKNVECPPHRCFKNFDRNKSSTSMESDAIAEGFNRSVEMHGLIYRTLISDNDSSVYYEILNCNPYQEYGVIVKKVQCCNHLYRRLCINIRDIGKIPQSAKSKLPIAAYYKIRKIVSESSEKIRNEIYDATMRRIESDEPDDIKAAELQRDILLIPQHVFGDHTECAARGFDCTSETPATKNHMPSIVEHGLHVRLQEIISNFSAEAPSLLVNQTNNKAELFNSVLVKAIEGKRVFFNARDSFEARALATVVQYNSNHVLSELHKKSGKKVPNIIEDMEKRRRESRLRVQAYREVHGRSARSTCNRGAESYGPNANATDMDATSYRVAAERHRELQQGEADNWKQNEIDTREQNDCEKWFVLRAQRITASNFGLICKKRPSTQNARYVSDILYPSRRDNLATKHGKDNEKKAIQLLSKTIKKDIRGCGIFLDQQHPYLGASPDGLVGQYGCVEVKCPYSAADKKPGDKPIRKTFADAVKTVKVVRQMFKKNDTSKLNPNNNYYFQVQGQMFIAKKKYCYFAVWTGDKNESYERENDYFHYVRVDADKDFWEKKMLPKLIQFYYDAIEPEIIDSRRRRGLPLRGGKNGTEAVQNEESSNTGNKRKQTAAQKNQTRKKQRKNAEKDTQDCIEEDTSLNPELNEPFDDRVLGFDDEVFDMAGTDEERREMINNRFMDLTFAEALILPLDTTIIDTVADSFMKIVRDTTYYETESTMFSGFRDLILPCEKESIQLLHSGAHWRCLYYDKKQLFVYDSIACEVGYERFLDHEDAYIRQRFNVDRNNVIFPAVATTQIDDVSCGVFAIAFATSKALNKNPATERYSENRLLMRQHLLKIVTERRLTLFPYR